MKAAIENFANDFDLSLFRLSEAARRKSNGRYADDWLVLSVELQKLRRLVRKHMSPEQRAKTS